MTTKKVLQKDNKQKLTYTSSEKLDKISLLEAALNSVTDSIKIIDSNFNIVFMNKTAANYTKEFCYEEFQPPTNTQINSSNFLTPQSPCSPCPAIETFKSKKPSYVKMEVYRKNGEKRIMEFYTYPIIKNTTVEYVVEIAKDVTERTKMEDEFFKAAKLACSGEISAIMAHEIRNPLNTILNAVKLLFNSKQSRTQEELTQLQDIIKTESNRLNKILDDFLNYSKPLTPTFEKVSINEVINDVLYLLKLDKTLESKITFNILLDENMPKIDADSSLLKQLLWNIIINSIQAMPEGGTLKIITTTDKASEKLTDEKPFSHSGETFAEPKKIFIIISDTGVGISEEKMKKIFTPFFTDKPFGTGLGLTIAKRIVNMHNGNIQIKSSVGKGTQILIELPISQQQSISATS